MDNSGKDLDDEDLTKQRFDVIQVDFLFVY